MVCSGHTLSQMGPMSHLYIEIKMETGARNRPNIYLKCIKASKKFYFIYCIMDIIYY